MQMEPYIGVLDKKCTSTYYWMNYLLLRQLYSKFSRKEELSHEVELDRTSLDYRRHIGIGLTSSYKLANRDSRNCSRRITLSP